MILATDYSLAMKMEVVIAGKVVCGVCGTILEAADCSEAMSTT
jgi:hypothetical protein